MRSERRAAIAIQEIVDPRTGALENTIGRRDVRFQFGYARFRFRAFVYGNPDAGLVDDFAASHGCAATRTVTKILRAGLRADVFHVAEDAIAAGLAAEEGRLDGELCAFDCEGDGGMPIDGAEDCGECATKFAGTVDGEDAH